jgi:hypothetical protein
MSTVDWLHKMRDAGLSQEQAEAIADGLERRSGQYVTREYLDARLGVTESRLDARLDVIESQVDARISRLLNDLTWRMIGLGVIVITAIGLLDKLVRP